MGDSGPKVRCLCLDASAISDVDYSAGQTVLGLVGQLSERGVRLVFADVTDPVRAQLDRYSVTEMVGPDAFYPDTHDLVASFGAGPGTSPSAIPDPSPQDGSPTET